MLRRVKSEVLDQLPEKVEKVLRCELSSWQKELYKQISVKAVEENGLLGNNLTQSVASRGLNNVVMQLRKGSFLAFDDIFCFMSRFILIYSIFWQCATILSF